MSGVTKVSLAYNGGPGAGLVLNVEDGRAAAPVFLKNCIDVWFSQGSEADNAVGGFCNGAVKRTRTSTPFGTTTST